MKPEEAKKLQNLFILNLNEISRRKKWKKDLNHAKKYIENIRLLYKLHEDVIKLFNDYSSIVSEIKYKSIHGEGFKILTPKQMLQRLSVALSQLKAGNTSENILNEIIYSLYRAKEIT